ncbi:MAG: tRNA uracil 4-sulfurtransferase ThiI [Candidatus Hodarchaeales archaeon]|jgi:thiamine biosynthesis protein ThiI
MYNAVLVHYSEIAIKGGNRKYFEQHLVSNLKTALKKLHGLEVQRNYGRITIWLQEKSDIEKIEKIIKRVPGVANFSFCLVSQLDIASIKEKILESHKIEGKNALTFRITTKRGNKSFPMTSMDVSRALGTWIIEKKGLKVDLTNHDINFNVEITEKDVFLYTRRIKGMGGLPVGSNGKLVALLSGGIDSPVAACRMLSRGCSIILVHFSPHTSQGGDGIDKIYQLARVIAKYQPMTKLYSVPFVDIQKKLIMFIPPKLRMIVYRRVMLEIAERILLSDKAKGFVTGDSLGQVASQTPENIRAIWSKTSWPILAPLIGENKESIIDEAKRLGTYEISIIPYADICSFNIAIHPETKADLQKIEMLEKQLDIDDEINRALELARSDIKHFF